MWISCRNMYGEDYLDNLFSAVYYEPTGQNALFQSHDGRGSAHHQIRKPSKKPSGGGKKTARGLDASANGFGRPSTGSKFVNNIRQHSSTSKSPAIADHKQKRPVSAPAKKRNGKLYKPASVPEITSYDSYVKRRQMDLARTEPTKKMDSAEYPFFPVLANVQPINESPSRVTYSEPEASVVANDSYFTNSAAYESVMTVEKPSAVNGVKKNSTRPYDLDKQYIDMNEWIGLRQNYIHQVESLEKYERMCGAAQVLSEISMPNFYSLLIAIRKITVRIADHYRMIVLQKETPINLLEIHGYVITMATDLDCLDRQPFVDWTGLHLSYNPFICGYRLDGKISTAMADLNAASKRMAESNPAMIPTELVMDQYETSECRDLSAVVWGAYQEDQRKRRTKAEEDEAIREQMIQASVRKAELAMKREAFEFSGPEAMQARCWKRAWVAWKKAYHLEISIKNMASVRKHMIKRNVSCLNIFL